MIKIITRRRWLQARAGGVLTLKAVL